MVASCEKVFGGVDQGNDQRQGSGSGSGGLATRVDGTERKGDLVFGQPWRC